MLARATCIALSALLGLFLLSSGGVDSQSADMCMQSDIIFVLDSSGSILQDNWLRVLKFVQYVVNATPGVSFYGTRFGVVSFGNEATINLNLNTFNTSSDIMAAVDKIPYKDENTNTSGGLYLMMDVMFTAQNGARPNVPHVAVVITDGQSTYDHNKTIPYAKEAKAKGILIVAIGVGTAIDQDELNGIASVNLNGTPIVYNVDNYAVLNTIQEEITQVACDPPVACGGTVDVAFIVESSYNINSEKFSQAKEFIKSVIDIINVINNGSNVALLTYNSKATLQFDLSKYHTRADLKTAIDLISYSPDSSSNLADALRLARQSVFSNSSGDRPQVPNFIVIITNRASSNASATSSQAQLTKLAGVQIMTIAINSWLSTKELYDITSFPVDNNLRILDSYAQLPNQTGLLKTTMCDFGFNACSSSPCKDGGTCQTTMNGYYCICPPGRAGINCDIGICHPADVALALDMTTLISADDFYRSVVPFARSFAFALNIQPTQTQLAVEAFASSTAVNFYLNRFTTPMDAVNGINPSYTGGYRNTSSALDSMTYDLFSASQGARSGGNVNRVGVIVTYGGSVNSTQTIASAIRAKDQAIQLIVVAVGVTNPSSMAELSAVASDPSAVNVIYVDQLQNLTSVIPTLASYVCNSVDECASGPCSNGTCTNNINSYSCKCPPGRSGTNCNLACGSAMDLVILIDSSGSVRENRFTVVKNFTQNLISPLLISPSDAQVAVITFADFATVRFHLNTYRRKGDILAAVAQLPYSAGRTNTADALRRMVSEVLTAQNGARQGVPRYAIVITDGESTVNQNDTLPAAIDAKNSGVHIMAVTVMPEGPTLELKGEVSDPYDYNLFSVANYSDLVTIQSRLITSMCNDVNECASNPCKNGGTCVNGAGKYNCLCPDSFTGISCERGCTKQLDIVFVLDSSGSLQNAFECSLALTKFIVQGLNFAQNRTRVGIETFSTDASVGFYLNRYSDLSSVLNAIAYFQASGYTNTPAAFDLMTTGMFSVANGNRPGVTRYALVVTDGFSNVNPQDTIPKAEAAQQSGITMIGVGISDQDGVNTTEIEGISSSPASKYSFIFNCTGNAEFISTANRILDAICQ